MRILVANGLAREDGYTKDILDLFLEGIRDTGTQFDVANLRNTKIEPCRGCYGCWAGQNNGKCVIKDEMPPIMDRYLNSDMAVFVSPLYFYSFSAKLKIFFERLLPITKPFPSTTASSGAVHSTLRNPALGPKSAALIIVAGQRDSRGMDGVVKTFELVCGALSLKPVGMLLRNESFFLDFPASKPKTTARIRAAFKKAGTELATIGQITEQTQQEASLPLTSDQASFEILTEKYWQTVGESGENLLDRDKIRTIFSQDLNMLIPLLAGCVNPGTAADSDIDFVLDLDGRQPGLWHFRVSQGKCTVTPGGFDNPALTIKMASEKLLDIIFQRADPRQVIAKGEMKVTGDRSLFKIFARLFSAT